MKERWHKQFTNSKNEKQIKGKGSQGGHNDHSLGPIVAGRMEGCEAINSAGSHVNEYMYNRAS